MSGIYTQPSAHSEGRGISSAQSLSRITLFLGQMKPDATLVQLQGPEGPCAAVAAPVSPAHSPSNRLGGDSCLRPGRHCLLGW